MRNRPGLFPVLISAFFIFAFLLTGCGGGGGDTTAPGYAPEISLRQVGIALYVDVNSGDDLKTVPSQPQTLTHALAVAQDGDTVYAAAGIYSAGTGEVFPLTIQGITPNFSTA